MQIMNCLIKKYPILIGHVLIKVLSFFQNIFIEFAKLCIPSKTIVVREDDKTWYVYDIRRNSRKETDLRKQL